MHNAISVSGIPRPARMTPVAAVRQARAPGPFRAALAWSCIVAAYVVLDAVSFVFPYELLPVTPWNPQAGLAIAVSMACGRRYASAIVFASVASELLLRAHSAALGGGGGGGGGGWGGGGGADGGR